MRNILLVRFGEIFLKGLNRPYFLKVLLGNIKEAVKPINGHVWMNDSRVFVDGFSDIATCAKLVTKVFGVHSVCPAIEMEKTDFSAICRQAEALMAGKQGSFKVVARRSDKHYPLTSPQINAQVGECILRANQNLTVDVHKPLHEIAIEIRDLCYMYTEMIMAVGGMPVGTNGRATLLLSGGIDSPVAGFMIAKRGVRINAVYYHSHPYTSERAKEKVMTLARILSESCCGIRLHIVPFTKIQTEIHEKCDDSYTTLVMRRFMMRIAECIAKKENAQALITGESIGQVASQTMGALALTDNVVNMPIFRPLIGFDKQEIIDVAQRIGTFETSSLPYEDCCTVFTPLHPATHPRQDRMDICESKLDIEALIADALEGIEIKQF